MMKIKREELADFLDSLGVIFHNYALDVSVAKDLQDRNDSLLKVTLTNLIDQAANYEKQLEALELRLLEPRDYLVNFELRINTKDS